MCFGGMGQGTLGGTAEKWSRAVGRSVRNDAVDASGELCRLPLALE